MPPESNPRDEHRGDESAEHSARIETGFSERMTGYRSECAANTAECGGDKE
jgi:hypothetical protein